MFRRGYKVSYLIFIHSIEGIKADLSMIDSEIEKILSWISPLEPQKRHYDIRQKRLEGTGGWFLQQLEFQQWIDEYSPKQNSTDTGSILTCSGIPGAGKSVICSLVIDDLITRFPPEGDVCVAYLYCDYRDQLDQTPVNMIGALLKQAISTLNESYSLPEELVEALRKRQKKRGGEQLNLKESHDFLVKAVKQFEKFYICLDALDECNTKHCANLLESLANVTKESSQECEIRLFVTGRPHLGWEDYIRRHPSLGAPVHICLEANQDDIRKFIAHEIEVDDNEDCMNDTLKNEIVERIVKNSDRMLVNQSPFPTVSNVKNLGSYFLHFKFRLFWISRRLASDEKLYLQCPRSLETPLEPQSTG